MSSIVITGKQKGLFDDTGRASILRDGLHAFEGRSEENRFAFEITDLSGSPVARSTPEPFGRWQAF